MEVTWLMNGSNPPMYISMEDLSYNAYKHSRFSGHGNHVQYYVWPCVYFSEDIYKQNGNVMAKGEVVLTSAAKNEASKKDDLKHQHVNVKSGGHLQSQKKNPKVNENNQKQHEVRFIQSSEINKLEMSREATVCASPYDFFSPITTQPGGNIKQSATSLADKPPKGSHYTTATSPLCQVSNSKTIKGNQANVGESGNSLSSQIMGIGNSSDFVNVPTHAEQQAQYLDDWNNSRHETCPHVMRTNKEKRV